MVDQLMHEQARACQDMCGSTSKYSKNCDDSVKLLCSERQSCCYIVQVGWGRY